MGQITILQQEGLLELDGILLRVGDHIECRLLGFWVAGTISHNERGWYLCTRGQGGIRLQTGLPARLLPWSSNAFPWPTQWEDDGEESLDAVKHFGENSSEDDSLGREDIDRIFSRLNQLHLPADFVSRVMQAVSHLPLAQM